MNNQFASHVRSTAFSLTLSQTAIDELFQLAAYATTYGLPMYAKSVEGYLLRRGLIERPEDPTCSMNWVLSKAGKITVELLMEAGFENKYKQREEKSYVCHG